MLHLHTERLAALGDDVPTPDEAAHLAGCAYCAAERQAYQSLVAMAHAEREPFALPLTRWDAISSALAEHRPEAVVVPPMRPRGNRLLQIAAGLLLVAGGAIAGRVSVGAAPLPGSIPLVAAASGTKGLAEANVAASADSSAFVSIDDARSAQQRSEMIYQQAAVFLARYDTTTATGGSPVAVRSRLAALDQVISTTREAMRQAPHDPVLNVNYLTTLGQREATLSQLNTALPASLRVNSF